MNILAVNPWIHDFAAFDFWLKPYGFLSLLTLLKQKGHSVSYLDCTDKKITKDPFGRGRFSSLAIAKPPLLASLPRVLKRYGISENEFRHKLSCLNPDLIMLTSSMTYWYTGLKETWQILREIFPAKPVVIGGTYATLMPEHAAEHFPGSEIIASADIQKLNSIFSADIRPEDIYSTLPDYGQFYPDPDYIVIRTSWGCPFNCSYCAIKQLSPVFFRLAPEKISDYISVYADKGIKNFAFYDDALLYPKEEAVTLLEKIKRLDLSLNFHTPNAMHLRYIDENTAYLLKSCGFINPHFGLETLDTDLQKQWGGKVSTDHLKKAVRHLNKAGYRKGEFSVYMLLGFPGQDLAQLKKDINYIHSLGAKISLAEFSPVPGTRVYNRFAKNFPDPLQHNNSIFSFFRDKIEEFYKIKNYVRELNKSFG